MNQTNPNTPDPSDDPGQPNTTPRNETSPTTARDEKVEPTRPTIRKRERKWEKLWARLYDDPRDSRLGTAWWRLLAAAAVVLFLLMLAAIVTPAQRAEMLRNMALFMVPAVAAGFHVHRHGQLTRAGIRNKGTTERIYLEATRTSRVTIWGFVAMVVMFAGLALAPKFGYSDEILIAGARYLLPVVSIGTFFALVGPGYTEHKLALLKAADDKDSSSDNPEESGGGPMGGEAED